MRTRQISAEAINSESIEDMIQLENKSSHSVQSFTNNDIFYQVEVDNNQMIKCTCEDFEYNRIACKHMYLLHRFKDTIQLYQGG